MSPKHFLNYEGLSKEFIISIIDRGLELKSLDRLPKSLENKSLGLIFEKPSTRTRVSFEIGIQKLGGNSIFLSSSDLQMSRGEPISDTAKVLSSMLDAVVIRTTNHELLEIFSKNSSVPVINGLSDLYHPCQILADLMTFKEFQGNLDISKVAWIGDSNNVCNSYIEAAKLLDFNLNIYCPKGYEPNSAVMKSQKNNVVSIEKILVEDFVSFENLKKNKLSFFTNVKSNFKGVSSGICLVEKENFKYLHKDIIKIPFKKPKEGFSKILKEYFKQNKMY